MRTHQKAIIALLAGLGLGACVPATTVEQIQIPQPELVACKDPRPQMCTAIYDPVCGLTADDSYQTYASACTACGDTKVSGHRPGACE
jgi:hypothetical protein